MEETAIKGQIICASSNKYTVDLNGQTIVINARKKIKYKSGDILTGDFVEIENGAISAVYPRTSRFYRPNVANIDTLLITISQIPKPDYRIVDKLLLSACYSDIEYAIVVNKCDLGNDTYQYIIKHYNFCKIFAISTVTCEGIDELKEYLKGKTVAFAGQSAVGKTSILNCILNTEYRVGHLSEKLERGKHTTTGSRIVKGENFAVLDTPGFSEIAVDMSPDDVPNNFPPYGDYLNRCKYPDCKHFNEPDCSVINAVKNGILSADRHDRYKEILKEIQTNYVTRYDKKH
ncbi:MAG: ribosome small subunit-dependent GTPase A [Clostridia bacterium]|nr:ribosome small subunit-dependent GTPase A [Clostridia bacterium]